MKKEIYILSAALVWIGSTGCNKNNPPELAGSYKTSAVLTLEAPVMYTKNGMITDAGLIKDFLLRDTSFTGDRDTGFLFNQTEEPDHFPAEIVFSEKDTAWVTTHSGTASATALFFSQRKNNTSYVLVPADSAILYLNSFQAGERIYNIYYQMEENNSGHLVYYYTPFTGAIAKGSFNLGLQKTGDQWVLPYARLHFNLAAYNGKTGGQYWYNNAWISLSKDIPSLLVNGDTIVLQKKTAELIRQ